MNALHRNVARRMLAIMRTMRERVWEAANVKLEIVTMDTGIAVPTQKPCINIVDTYCNLMP